MPFDIERKKKVAKMYALFKGGLWHG